MTFECFWLFFVVFGVCFGGWHGVALAADEFGVLRIDFILLLRYLPTQICRCK
mgnify:CR=1 FL=1